MNNRRPSQPWMEGNWYQPTALVAPLRHVMAWVLLGLALCADTVAFYSVVAKVLGLSAAQTITLVIGLTAIAVGMSGEIGRDLRRRKASDPSRNVGLLWVCLGGWLGLGVVGTLARILYGARTGVLGQI